MSDEQRRDWDAVAQQALGEQPQGDDGHNHIVIAGASEGTGRRVRGTSAATWRAARRAVEGSDD